MFLGETSRMGEHLCVRMCLGTQKGTRGHVWLGQRGERGEVGGARQAEGLCGPGQQEPWGVVKEENGHDLIRGTHNRPPEGPLGMERLQVSVSPHHVQHHRSRVRVSTTKLCHHPVPPLSYPHSDSEQQVSQELTCPPGKHPDGASDHPTPSSICPLLVHGAHENATHLPSSGGSQLLHSLPHTGGHTELGASHALTSPPHQG